MNREVLVESHLPGRAGQCDCAQLALPVACCVGGGCLLRGLFANPVKKGLKYGAGYPERGDARRRLPCIPHLSGWGGRWGARGRGPAAPPSPVPHPRGLRPISQGRGFVFIFKLIPCAVLPPLALPAACLGGCGPQTLPRLAQQGFGGFLARNPQCPQCLSAHALTPRRAGRGWGWSPAPGCILQKKTLFFLSVHRPAETPPVVGSQLSFSVRKLKVQEWSGGSTKVLAWRGPGLWQRLWLGGPRGTD